MYHRLTRMAGFLIISSGSDQVCLAQPLNKRRPRIPMVWVAHCDTAFERGGEVHRRRSQIASARSVEVASDYRKYDGLGSS